MDRRQFLGASAAAGLTLCLGVPKTQAMNARYEGPFVVVFNATGGWDTTYLMDPKGTPEINRLYAHDEIDEEGAIRFAPTAGRIAAGEMSNRQFCLTNTKS